MSSRILVTDGEQRAALAIVRSLGRSGHRCLVASTHRRSLAGASRFAAGRVRLPDALVAPTEFRDALVSAALGFGADVILPVADPSLFAVLEEPRRFAPAVVPFPDLVTVRRTADKQHVLDLAGRHEIAVPRQTVAATREQALDLASSAVGFPMVIKPVRSVAGENSTRVKVGVSWARTPDELHRRLRLFPTQAFPVLLQERIRGEGIGVFLLLWGGEVRAVFAHRRLREKPPAGGVSTYRESIPVDPGLLRRSRGLLGDLGWQGVAMVEYKVDAVSRTPYLMEINGRFWGSLQLAIDAGVDFPRLLVELALGGDPGHLPDYRPGIRSRWEWGDLDHLLARLRRSPSALGLPPDAPSRVRVLRDVLWPWRPGDRWEVFRPGDPGPFLRESVDWIRGR